MPVTRSLQSNLILNYKGCSCVPLFNWAAYYKPNSLPSSTVGSSSSGNLCRYRKRRT